MPRDATHTRERLIREAERLFARNGAWQVAVREIAVAAGQRNASVIHYHFGSLDGLRLAILQRHGGPADAARGTYLENLGHDPSTRELVDALLVAYSGSLRSPAGRDYLRIVAQHTGYFSNWETVPDSPCLVEILRRLRDTPAGLSPEVREQRVITIVILISGAMGERAKHLDRDRVPGLDHQGFVNNLANMIVAALLA